MKRYIVILSIGMLSVGALAEENTTEKKQTQAQNSKVEKQLVDVSKRASRLQDNIEDVDAARDQVTALEQRLEDLEQRIQDLEGTEKKSESDLESELKKARQNVEEAREQIQKAEKQEQWHLESRVTTADPVDMVWDIDRFNTMLEKNALLVVYFYELPEEQTEIITKDGVKRRTDRWYTVDRQAVSFASVAKNTEYQKAGVQFVMANLSKDDMDRLKKQYDIKSKDTIMIFQDGVPYTKKKLEGPFDTHEIRNFVTRYLDDVVEERIKEMEKRKKRKRERKEVRYVYDDYSRPRFSIGFGYGPYYDPYHYGYPYYHRRYYGHPGFSWHFGW